MQNYYAGTSTSANALLKIMLQYRKLCGTSKNFIMQLLPIEKKERVLKLLPIILYSLFFYLSTLILIYSVINAH